LAKAFIDYCLTSSVQSYVAFNQWMFPANDEITLPAAFSYALHVDDVHILNTLLPRSEIAANLTLWLDEWDIIFSS
jgi:ABC-type thiamine transport system substrate-binding protein